MRLGTWIAAVVVVAATSSAFGQAAKVVVAPFVEANEQQQPDWISRAIQQSVADDLAALEGVDVVDLKGTAQPTTAQAKSAGATFLVNGTIQRLGNAIRVTGRVTDVNADRSVGGFKATADQRALFGLEDSISRQLKKLLAPEEEKPALEDPQPLATSTPTDRPAASDYNGSELQRAVRDEDWLRRIAERGSSQYTQPVVQTTTPVYYPPQQPYYPGYSAYPSYGYGYGYNSGWCGGGTTVIINKNNGDGGSGGGGGPVIPRPNVQAVQMQAIRQAAVYGNGSAGSMVAGPVPARQPITSRVKH